MIISKIKITNYRLLKNFELDLENDLSLVIGKNNSGKTSLLTALDKFLNPSLKKGFTFDDFNIDFKDELNALIGSPIIEETYKPIGISLQLFIKYNDVDSLENLRQVLMDLEPTNNTVLLSFEYFISYSKLKKLIVDFKSFQDVVLAKTNKKLEQGIAPIVNEKRPKNLFYFLKDRHKEYFEPRKRTISIEDIIEGGKVVDYKINENVFKDLDDKQISLDNIINFKLIPARRDVTNKEADKTLSILSSSIYEKMVANKKDTNESKEIENFIETLSETDNHLDRVYVSLFGNIIEKVKQFGGIKEGDSIINIISTLQQKELLKGNTTVIYNHNENHSLPENYNGLGYMNLISMIFDLELLINEFRRESQENKKPADINLLFIEEPEAHTHPQMQYAFIKNIKDILLKASQGADKVNATKFTLQSIISTHSSHIVSASDFNDIKYLKKINHCVFAKNLKDLQKEYEENGEEKHFKFLKQYLTLSRSELFFADKAVFIEGDTERILLPAMMKKIDQENTQNPLLSQNISIVEVGAYSHIFEKFISFIGVKSLIITDIDSGYKKVLTNPDGSQQTYANGSVKTKWFNLPASDVLAANTSNSSLRFFHNKKSSITYYKNLPFEKKLRKRKKTNNKWAPSKKGNILIVYQTEQNNYCARSFEDAFFNLNKDFITNLALNFPSLTKKYLNKYRASNIDDFEFSENGVTSKPTLAMEILLNSITLNNADGKEIQFSNWKTPQYINEGLLWLKKD